MKDVSKQGDKLAVRESCDSRPISLQHEDGATMHHNPNGFHKSCLLHTFFRAHSSSLQTRIKAIQVPTDRSLRSLTAKSFCSLLFYKYQETDGGGGQSLAYDYESVRQGGGLPFLIHVAVLVSI